MQGEDKTEMRRTSRLFEIIQLLRSAKQPLTAAALAETLEVTKRTVYRDVASLQAMSVPIYGEAGVGYVMRPGYDLPPLMLSVEEVEALVVALSLLGRTGDKGLKSAAETIRGGQRSAAQLQAADRQRQPVRARVGRGGAGGPGPLARAPGHPGGAQARGLVL